jgi:hypothetical protein
MIRRLLAIALLTACSHKTPEEQLLEAFGPAKSWAATLQFAEERWTANSVPSAFVRATIAAAEKDFDKTAAAIDKSQARKDLRDHLRHQLASSRAAAERLRRKLP